VLVAPAGAVRSDMSPYKQYVRARAADAAGLVDLAAAEYGAVLSTSPDDVLLANRTYRQALIAGNEALAVKSAALLDAAGALPPDGRLLFLIDKVAAKDWKGARVTATQIEREQALGFMVPAIRAWLAFGSGVGDPLSELSKAGLSGLASAYSPEHRVLLALAMGQPDDAATIIKAGATSGQMRDVSLRLLTAQSLAAQNKRDAALALVAGDDAALIAMQRQLQSKRRIAPPVIDAAFGISQLLLRVAVDVNRERVTPLSPSLARMATFVAPKSVDARIAAAQMLAVSEFYDPAIALLRDVPAANPWASFARSTRIRILISRGARAEALADIQAVTSKPDATAADWTLLGDIYNGLQLSADAAAAYGRAIDLVSAKEPDDDQLGSLWLLKGSALDQAGSWPEARNALEKSLALAPDQPVTLNYLGYAKLERREDIPKARALIERASALRPDDAAITDSLGWAHYVQGDYDTAITKLEAAVAGDPGGSEINEHLGDAYWSRGRRIEARYAWRAALVTAQEKDASRLTRKIDLGLDKDGTAP